VLLTNTSANAVPGPVYLIVRDLPAGYEMRPSAGLLSGAPYLIASEWAVRPGRMVAVNLVLYGSQDKPPALSLLPVTGVQP